MLSSWVPAALPIVVAVAVLFVPGFFLVRAAGGRSAMALGLGPVVGTSIISVAAELLYVAHLPWTLWTYTIIAIICCAATILLRKLTQAIGPSLPHSDPKSNHRVLVNVLVALALAAVLLGARLLVIFGSPENISQTTDDVFHLNTIRLMLDLGNGSMFTPALLNGEGPGGFYPAAWHSTVALVAASTGASIPVAVNSVNLVIGALVWPTGAIFMVRQVFGNRRLIILSAGVLCVCFAAFPFRLLDWGVLYPNYFAMALIMPLWGLGTVAMQKTRSADVVSSPMTWWLVLTALPAAVLVHTNALLMLVALMIPLVIALIWRLWRHPAFPEVSRGSKLRLTLIYSGMLVAAMGVWTILRPIPLSNITTNPPYQSTAQAIGEWLSGTDSNHLAAIGTVPLVVIGAARLIHSRNQLWLIGSYGAASLLFIAATGFELSVVRTFLTGGWYDDYNRLTGLLVVTGLPLGALGTVTAVDWIRRKLARRWHGLGARPALWIGTALTLGAVIALSQIVTVSPAAASAKARFNISPGAPMMSSDEYRLFQRLDSLVPPDSAIAGNPWNGSAMAYWVSGRHLVFSHIFVPMTPDRDIVARGLRVAGLDPAICPAVKRLHIGYVLWSSEPEFSYGNPHDGQFDGMKNMDQAYGFAEVAREGTAALFKITACS